jgi:hypothetical protein
MSNVLLVNITWNPFGWRNTYVNPKAGHSYARKNPGGESLNFNFSKKGIDTAKFVKGFVQWKYCPVNFQTGGLIIFYTRNTDEYKGQIVGIYSNAEVFSNYETYRVSGFKNNEYPVNIKAEKELSLLFPIPLNADSYKSKSSDRIVGQIGFTYKDIAFAEKIFFDELIEMSNAGISSVDFEKLKGIYQLYTGKKFQIQFLSRDEKEQIELEHFYKKTKTKEEIRNDLKNLTPSDPQEVIVNHKAYKKDNKTIAQLKILRDFKCQICKASILKKDGSKYVEAAHIEAKHKKGRETPDNILILCPNHHKEFDFGNVAIKKHTPDLLEFKMNHIDYSISLKI